ncbi:LOW QUALITY PROTEIN: annexin D3-like [Aristolochia californica]|uniref:LOW QUALITY PROTEIN: annexin D3-like n=1 Tax=Aristolochia californica TaxID=171875 RepID=UPI0035E191EC
MATITIPEPLPSPVEDSETLRKALQGWGTDEKAIIRILGHRNAIQRLKICQTYEQLYQESLVDRLHSELSGDFQNAVIQWLLDPPQRDAKMAKEALKSKDVKRLLVLVEIACASSPDHLIAVRRAYCSLFRCSIEEDIILHVEPPFRKLLVSLLSSFRFEGEETDEAMAQMEATILQEAIKKNVMDEDYVVWILSTRNKFQLKTAFDCYRKIYKISIEEDIRHSLSGDLVTAVRCIHSPEKHFAEVVRSSIVGLGTHEDLLTRAIVTRAEVDMEKIKEEYLYAYNVKLIDDVMGDTSGDYKDILLTLLAEGKL